MSNMLQTFNVLSNANGLSPSDIIHMALNITHTPWRPAWHFN